MESFFANHRKTYAEVNLDNLIHNFKLFENLVGSDRFFCPMIKANAYGHGDVDVAIALEKAGAKTLGVCLLEEGIVLRQMGIKSEILVFGMTFADSISEVLKWNLTPVISDWRQLEDYDRLVKKNTNIHIKFDTGMHRLGFSVEHAERVSHVLRGHPFLKLKGILTHLHSAEDAQNTEGHSFNQFKELAKAEKHFEDFNIIVHALNSSGTLNVFSSKQWPSILNKDVGIRIGLALYGYSSTLSEKFDLRPVMSLRSRVVRYHNLKRGETVSYSATWKVEKDSVVGVVPIGYADGFRRALSNKGEVLFQGKRVPVAGTVCMDFILIDVTNAVGSSSLESLIDKPVTLFGYDEEGNCISAQEVADKTSTIPWEVLTSVGERVPRVFKSGASQ